ncbi:MAG: hypothetical protein ILA34_04150 [Bacteroidaceae bacterium]|nr:hypothetical protein [Bacteroidaceae bacterium]
MNNKLSFHLAAAHAVLMVLLLFGSCSNKEHTVTDVFEENEIPESVVHDFFRRNGRDVSVTQARNFQSESFICIYYTDAQGMSAESHYSHGVWQLDMKRITDMEQMPVRVIEALLNMGWGDMWMATSDDRVALIVRNGIDHQLYDMRFHTPQADNSWLTCYLLINEDGTVLEQSHDGFNRSEWYRNLDDALDFVRTRYEGCDVRGHANHAGYDEFYILHDGYMKQVYFYNNYKKYKNMDDAWMKTEWELDAAHPLPDAVRMELDKIKADDTSDFAYDRVFYRETLHGHCYGLQDSRREDALTYWIPEP